MSDYKAPLKDMLFALDMVREYNQLDQVESLAEYPADFVATILDEAGKFAAGELSPLNAVGDMQGCRFIADGDEKGQVKTPDGWQSAYQQFCDNGWLGLALPADFGGQQLPRFVSMPVHEMWLSANLSFVMFQALTQGCSEILMHFGTDEQKAKYLEAIITGRWSVTMALTEPSAGSDLANTVTKAIPQGDGTYKIKGQKIFITYGEHDLTENIVHLVLARTPDAPAGSRGISLFAVPKFRINEDGSLGEANDVVCSGIEHKMGLHGSPTCTMNYGDSDGCIGELIGAENKGLMAMFVLMNEARVSTGMQGVAFGELGYQHALNYAIERSQGAHYQTGERVAIVRHPDVQRMLLSMASQTAGLRALGYSISAWIDLSEQTTDKKQAAMLRERIALLTPIFKAYATEQGNLMAGTCTQVYGGMGFVEETGVAQFIRDARITTIYEGTTGIQARDLMFRKILGDQGVALQNLLRQISSDADQLPAELQELRAGLVSAVASIHGQLRTLMEMAGKQADQCRLHAGSVPMLEAMGRLCSGWQLALMAKLAQQRVVDGNDAGYHANQVALAKFWFAHGMPQIHSLLTTVANATAGLSEFDFMADR
ncbi:acyl-CoA dehydrogenase [Oceanobacter mangrovi]|uniref:acyl-CoA dehydrogenase n=1 Tax=Oceanobacter mangrovi TaxID=2862510 RepID=UPI001C8E183D|nr:acyl-CoA dehydrogenase [Oceanobacter mangrovi]